MSDASDNQLTHGVTDAGGEISSASIPFDKRALSLIIFQKLQKELVEMDLELEEKQAARLIRDAINVLPDFSAEPGEKNNIVLVHSQKDPEKPISMNIQDAIDSLMIVWKDFQKLMAKL